MPFHKILAVAVPPFSANDKSASTAHAAAEGQFHPGNRVALLGIGSGINCIMLACQWGNTPVLGL
jgi:hypothetical protein